MVSIYITKGVGVGRSGARAFRLRFWYNIALSGNVLQGGERECDEFGEANDTCPSIIGTELVGGGKRGKKWNWGFITA
jgi:hypothetical protein